MTDTGDIQNTAISPDGKFILTVDTHQGQQSLWLKNLPTGSVTEVVPPSGRIFSSLAFSPDGSYIYYRQISTESSGSLDLYRAPLLGGTPTIVAKDVTPMQRFHLGQAHRLRSCERPGGRKVEIAAGNADGSDEKVLLFLKGRMILIP